MSDTFADEFEKWLENSPDARNTDVTEAEDSNDERINYREFANNTVQNYGSDSEKLQTHLSYEHVNKLSFESINDQAPILVDDDDDDGLFSNKRLHYEDEPPILEPIPNELQSFKISTLSSPQFSPQTCMRNYSRNNQVLSRKSVLNEQRTYSNKDKGNHISPVSRDKSNDRNSLKSKDNKSGNIFDKFISENYEDFPPPLIPSPEALQVESDSPSSVSNPSRSPDFCAMEADSTSEINGCKLGSVFRSQRMSKSSVHEVSVECDSTCMLAASPVIVSPASVSNGELEETRDSVEGGNKDGDWENSDNYPSKIYAKPMDGKTEKEGQSRLMQITIDKIECQDASNTEYCDKDCVSHIAEGLCSHSGPQTFDISTLSNSHCQSLSVTIKTDAQNTVPECCTEPPILSAVSPPSIRSHTKIKKKRHRFNQRKGLSRSRKRSIVKRSSPTNTESAVCDISTPPTLTNVFELVISNTSKGKRTKVDFYHSKSECLSFPQDESLSHRRRQRCNTVLGPDAHYSCLSDNLQSFVVDTSELSYLQTRMHRLLCEVFPQLKLELAAMSPEALQFEKLLSDLVHLLEQPDDQDHSTPLISCRDIKPASVNESQRLVAATSQLNSTSQAIIGEPSSLCVSTSDSQAAADFAKHVFKSDATSSNHTTLAVLSNDYSHNHQHKQQRHVKTRPDDDKDLMIPLSQLSVKDMEEILTPSKVLLCRDPGAVLQKFTQLSCRALQLMLPDLTVSVYTELAQSTRDLVTFIDNVILTNSRRRWKC